MGDSASTLIKQILNMPVNALGLVSSCADADFRVTLDRGECLAKRAASCLLVPEPGDSVLVCGPYAGMLFIIAVLERGTPVPSRLELGKDAAISASGHLSLTSDELLVRARTATTLIDQLSSFGRELNASIGKIKLVGNLLESFLDRLIQFTGHSLRTIEGVDQVRSTVIDYRADQSLNLQGSEVIATARELIKVDGKQIHIG